MTLTVVYLSRASAWENQLPEVVVRFYTVFMLFCSLYAVFMLKMMIFVSAKGGCTDAEGCGQGHVTAP